MANTNGETKIGEAKDDVVRLMLDDPAIQKRAAHYPESLRDHVLWLASYLRNECNRDLDILVKQANQLGIEFDKTTWSRVLRGQWDRDGEGAPRKSPIVNLTKLVKAIDTLIKDVKLREQAGRVPFVMTPTAQTIFDFVDKKRAPDRVNKFGLIVGYTGTQKTATLKEYCRRNNHGACVHQEAPATPSMKQFITDLAYHYGAGRNSSWDHKLTTIANAVNSRRCVILENVQRLYSERDAANQKVFNYLQKLQDDTGCTIIFTLTPVFVSKLQQSVAEGYFEQFIGRAGGEKDILTLEAYPSDDDVLAIVEAFNLRDAASHLPELTKIAKESGRVRVLFEALQEAKVQAGNAQLTIKHIRAVRGED